jgi:hypothetical protein
VSAEFGISGELAALIVQLEDELRPRREFARVLLAGLADKDGKWPEEVKGELLLILPIAPSVDKTVDVLEHTWSAGVMMHMGCHFSESTIENCIVRARQRDRF